MPAYAAVSDVDPATCPPPRAPTRPPLLLLAVTSLLSFGAHFGKHFLSSLAPAIIPRLGLSRAAFGLTFSFQELPGVVVPVLGSIAVSAARVRFGRAAVCLAALVTAGQALSAAAIHLRSLGALLAGRLLFGVGDGFLVVVQGAIVGARFREDGHMSLAFGAMLLSSRLSSYAGLASPGIISEQVGLVPAVYLSAAVCFLSFGAALVYALCLDPPSQDDTGSPSPSTRPQGTSNCAQFLTDAWAAVRELPPPFWLVAACWAALASAVFTFLHFASDIAASSPVPALATRSSLAGLISGWILLLSAVVSPFAGVAQDRYGRRVHILACACGLASAGLLSCAGAVNGSATAVLAGVALVALGFSVAPVTLLSCVALCVEDEAKLPTALGLFKASENVVMSQAHWVAGSLRDHSGDYMWTLLFLAGLAAAGALSAFALFRTSKASLLREGILSPAY